MTDPLINPQNDHPSVIRPTRLVAGFLWICCILAIMGIWYRLPATDVSDNDGRVTKTMKLDPGEGNELNIREVADPAHDDPWDADGIEDFSFTDSQGNRCQRKDLIGKPFVISFVFTYCRGPCPNVSLQMRELHERLKNHDFNLVSLTVDPER